MHILSYTNISGHIRSLFTSYRINKFQMFILDKMYDLLLPYIYWSYSTHCIIQKQVRFNNPHQKYCRLHTNICNDKMQDKYKLLFRFYISFKTDVPHTNNYPVHYYRHLKLFYLLRSVALTPPETSVFSKWKKYLLYYSFFNAWITLKLCCSSL